MGKNNKFHKRLFIWYHNFCAHCQRIMTGFSLRNRKCWLSSYLLQSYYLFWQFLTIPMHLLFSLRCIHIFWSLAGCPAFVFFSMKWSQCVISQNLLMFAYLICGSLRWVEDNITTRFMYSFSTSFNLISDLNQRNQGEGVTVQYRIWTVLNQPSTQAEETFIRIKVTWTRNKRESKWL